MAGEVSLRDLAAMLADRVDALVPELLPGARRDGAEWRCGSTAGEPGASLGIRRTGAKQGVWRDFAAAVGGDALDLVAACLYGGDVGQAAGWSRRWLGIESGHPTTDRIALERLHAEAGRRAAQKAAQAEREAQERRRAAKTIWLSARPIVEDGVLSPAALYLRDSRGIDVTRLPRVPRGLRFHPALYNQEAGRSVAALVVPIIDLHGEMVSLHRTWLDLRGSGGQVRWDKADLQWPRKTLGEFRGAAMRLWTGHPKRRLAALTAADEVTIGEGVEDGLSVALAEPHRVVLGAVSLSNLGSVALPPGVGVTILADNDWGNDQASKGLNAAVDRFWREQGRVVRVVNSHAGKDMNDRLLAGRDGEGVAA